MRVDELFPPEVIDEDIRKWIGGATLAGALAAVPMGQANKPQEVVPVTAMGPTQMEVAFLANTMWAEARSLGELGMLAVGNVIKNRADDVEHHRLFGQGIKGVVLKNKQFSCWNTGDPNRDAMKEMHETNLIIQTKTPPKGYDSYEDWYNEFKNSTKYREYKTWLDAFRIARTILNGTSKDPTNGATYYHTPAVKPIWRHELDRVGEIKGHIFYKLPE